MSAKAAVPSSPPASEGPASHRYRRDAKGASFVDAANISRPLLSVPSSVLTGASVSKSFSPSDVAVLETFVVPGYLRRFGERVVEKLIATDDAQVVHLRCLTGYPDHDVANRLPNAHIYGVDASSTAIELAKSKAAARESKDALFDYRVSDRLPVSLPSGAFSHAIELSLPLHPEGRERNLAEVARLLAPHGQAVLATTLRGSFLELLDLFREYALRHDEREVASVADFLASMQPTPEGLTKSMQDAGFEFVEVESHRETLTFETARSFFEDPAMRLFVLPVIREAMTPSVREAVMAYLYEAIEKYWSDSTFTVSLTVGCVNARRRASDAT